MIDLPVRKALVAEYVNKPCNQECIDEGYQCLNYQDCCKDCDVKKHDIGGFPDDDICGCLCCTPQTRADEKHVVYRLVDYP